MEIFYSRNVCWMGFGFLDFSVISKITGSVKMDWILSSGALYAISIIGMFSHFLKRKVKGESLTEIKNYFRDHIKSTLLALIATSIGFAGYNFVLATGMPADIFAVFGVGYMCDSMFNRYEGGAKYPV